MGSNSSNVTDSPLLDLSGVDLSEGTKMQMHTQIQSNANGSSLGSLGFDLMSLNEPQSESSSTSLQAQSPLQLSNSNVLPESVKWPSSDVTSSKQIQVEDNNLQNQVISDEKLYSKSIEIISKNIGGGLEISLRFQHCVIPQYIQGASSIVITCTNHSNDMNFRRIRLGFPVNLKRTPLQDIALLQMNSSVDLFCEMDLRPFVNTPLKVDLTTANQGHKQASLRFELVDLIQPRSLSIHEFDKIASTLPLIQEAKTTIQNPIS